MNQEQKKLEAAGIRISSGLKKALWDKKFLEDQGFRPSGEMIVVQGGRVVHIKAKP